MTLLVFFFLIYYNRYPLFAYEAQIYKLFDHCHENWE